MRHVLCETEQAAMLKVEVDLSLWLLSTTPWRRISCFN